MVHLKEQPRNFWIMKGPSGKSDLKEKVKEAKRVMAPLLCVYQIFSCNTFTSVHKPCENLNLGGLFFHFLADFSITKILFSFHVLEILLSSPNMYFCSR